MSQTLRTLGAVALGALVVAVAALSVKPAPVVGAPSDPGTLPARTITVSGTGKVTVVPDVARVNLGVTLTKTTVKAAREAAAEAMTSIIGGLKSLGIAEADIVTSGLNLYPQYANGSTSRITGYQVSEQLQVTVRDLDKAGDAVDIAIAKGATDVSGISFDVSEPAKVQDNARAAAVSAARTSAQALAAAGNVTLGAVVTISDETPQFVGYNVMAGARAAAPSDTATPVQPGTQDVTEAVTVVFAIN
jgi:uncharacterized protein YggE